MNARMCNPGRSRRAVVLIAVLVIIGSALFIATSLLFVIQSDVAAASGSRDVAQARALAWSGVLAVTAELNQQRDVILDGERPEIDREYILYETDTEFGVVRLLPLGIKDEHLVAEGGKLNVNTVDADALAETGLIDPALAEAIVNHRVSTLGRPFQSVAELLDVPGMTPDLLYGEIENLTVMDDTVFEGGDVRERLLALYESDEARGLADVVTVFGFEPALQRNGKLRINLNIPWSDELADRLEERFGEEGARLLKQIFDNGTTFENEARLFQLLRFFQVDPSEWGEATDVLTSEAGDYHEGRVDLNTAPYEALLGLPLIGAEEAAQIVQIRDELDEDERWTIAWPAIREIVPPEAYDELAGHITTRCWTWRIRIAAGTVDAANPDGELRNPVIYEAVIDLSAPQPRVAYLRDITLLQTAAQVAVNASLDDEVEREFADDPESDPAAGELQSDSDGMDDVSGADTRDSIFDGGGDDADPTGDRDRSDRRSSPSDDDGDESEDEEPPGSQIRRIGRWIGGR